MKTILPSDQAHNLCLAIEKLPASHDQTSVSILASTLYRRIHDIELIEKGWAQIIAADAKRYAKN